MAEMTDLLTTLRQAGLLSEGSPPHTKVEATTPIPWFVQILHALSGWLASLFFLLMLGAMFHRLWNTPVALLGVGLLLMILAARVLRRTTTTLFLEHGALTLSLAGQILVGLAVFQWGRPYADPLPWLAVAGMEGVLLITVPWYLHRLISAGVAGLVLIHAATLLGISTVATPLLLGLTVWIWMHEWYPPDAIRLKQAAGYGLSLALLWSTGTHVGEVFFLVDHASQLHFGLNHPGMTALLNSAIMLYTVTILTRNGKQGSTLTLFTRLLPLLPLSLLSIWMHGLIVALTLLIVGFARGNRLLQGMSLAALLWTVGRFYDTLQTTLLVKSALLIAVGAVLLTTYAVLKHREGAKDVL